MKKFATTLFIMFVLLLFTSNLYALIADGFEEKDFILYYGTTADTVTIGWDHGNGFNATTDTYELTIHNPERDINVVVITGIIITTHTMQLPKTGHWIVKLRTKRVVTDADPAYSIWAESTNPEFAKVNGEPRGWWIFTWIASTGPIAIPSNQLLMNNH